MQQIKFETDSVIDDRYKIISHLGEGGMGAVWKASDLRTDNSIVVLKFPLKYNDPEILERFSREASTMRALAGDCDNILDIQDIGSVAINQIDNVPYYVMRYQTGGALRDWKLPSDEQGNPIYTPESLNWVSGVATALDFLHQQPDAVFHRDVKPENILFNASGTPKLSDFGIVKSIKKATTSITRTGAAMGTVAYMPPEIWRGGKFSAASDQFSFASTVYEMLAGQRPYDGETPFAMLESLSRGHSKLSESLGISAPASQALDKALSHEPENRYESCGAFAKDFLQGLASAEFKKPSEMETGMHVNGIQSGSETGEIAGGQSVISGELNSGDSNSDGDLFVSPEPQKKLIKSPQPVVANESSKAPLLFAVAVVLAGLLGGGLYLSGMFSNSEAISQQQSAGAGSPTNLIRPASFQLAQNLFDGTDGETTNKSRAVAMLEELAKDGSLESQKRLGEIFSQGEYGDVDFKKAFDWLLMAAKQGDAESQMAVGASYSSGERGINRDLKEAIKWLRKSASQDFGPAQIMLGVHYSRGSGVDRDLGEAERWLERARSAGLAEAGDVLAKLKSEDVKELDWEQYKKSPLSLVEQHAELGFSGAQTELGFRASKSGDYKTALAWYRKAEKKNYMRALANIGAHYELGQGVPQSFQKSFEYYQRANDADPNYSNAQYKLGVAYASGNGVKKDEGEAVRWFRKAATQGDAQAQNSLGLMFDEGRGVVKNDREAVRWYRKAADQGDANAQHSLGFMYANGRGVEKDDRAAVRWYGKAAEQGKTFAQYNLGFMYANGRGVEKNDREAVRWYRKAAEQGYAVAQYNLGRRYDFGEGIGENDREAVRWYQKAAEQGYAKAQFNLGVMYANGEGVKKNEREAAGWYRKAAAQGNQKAKASLNRLKN